MDEVYGNQDLIPERGAFQPAPSVIGDQLPGQEAAPRLSADQSPVPGAQPQSPGVPQQVPAYGAVESRPVVPVPNRPQAGYVPVPPRVQVPVPEPKKKKKSGIGVVVAVALCCSLLGGAVGAGAMALLQRNQGQTALQDTGKQEQDTLPTDPAPGSQGEKEDVNILEGVRDDAKVELVPIPSDKLMTAAEVYAANVNSTVGITTSYTTTNFWGIQSTAAASGSGFIVSEDGYIVTNFHVVDKSEKIKVACYDGSEYDALLVGYDESNDIAVLKVEATGLSPVILGNSDQVNVGDDVVAIGNPLGELTFTLTAGKISAKDREVSFSNNVTMDLLQTDCAINSGNSGGALFNMHGEVVGVTNAKYSGNSNSGASIDNIAFAIPMNTVRPIVESIIEKGYVTKPYVGVTVSDVGQEYQDYGIPQGAAIQSVVDDGPAQKAGLKKGDIVTHVNGQELTSGKELVDIIGESNPGDVLALTVYRRGKTVEVSVTVEEQVVSAQ